MKAFNTATTSDNKIHDDDVARSYGFSGGLVPGVDVYAYLTHIPVDVWGSDFLSRGSISARFLHPVYDGDDVTIDSSSSSSSSDGDRDGLSLTLVDSRGEICATASASLPRDQVAGPPLQDVPPLASLPDTVPPASHDLFAPRPVLGSLEYGFHAEHAPAYLNDVRETLPIYRTEHIAHPGWLLRHANYVLSANARLGPWIHVSSNVQFHDLVHDGDALSTRASVIDEFERKGHKFVVLDVAYVANEQRVVMRVEHTSIYEPRRNKD
ncbi:MAG TPA: hypothetical protein VGJ03_15005 [Acidimicrobiales bacterium]